MRHLSSHRSRKRKIKEKVERILLSDAWTKMRIQVCKEISVDLNRIGCTGFLFFSGINAETNENYAKTGVN